MILTSPSFTASSAGPTIFVGIDEPLVGQHRLDDHFRAVPEGLHDRFGLDQRDQWLARLTILGRKLSALAKHGSFGRITANPRR